MIIVKNTQLEYALNLLYKVSNGEDALDSQSALYICEYIRNLENKHEEAIDKLSRRNMQIKELQKNKCIDFKTCKCFRNNTYSYCNADFKCYAVGNTPETKGCLTCKQYNR